METNDNQGQQAPKPAVAAAMTGEAGLQQLEIIKAKAKADFDLTPIGQQMALEKSKQEAAFALTPVGQELKRFEVNQRIGMMYASSNLVPDTYKGNMANCAIAIDMALRMGVNALMVMQNLYMVHGMPSWSSKFLVATINTCGRFQPLRYEDNGLTGDDYGWRCYTYDADDKQKNERLEGPWVTWKMVKAEGWDSKKGSKWLTMPEQMFRYRAAAFWQRLYAPEISMGFNTVEEAQDIVEDVDYVEMPHNGAEQTRGRSLADMAMQAAVAQSSDPTPTETFDVETGEVQPAK